MITGKSVTSAVCRRLHAAFPEIAIYREHIGENFAEPSFFVWTSNVDTVPQQYPRFETIHQIEVNYFPRHDDCNMYEHMLDVATELLEVLHFVEVGGPVWGRELSYRIIDDNMLQFSVTYSVNARLEEVEQPNMRLLDITVHAKQEG